MDRAVRPDFATEPARSVTDEELMARFRDGEATALDLLLDRHKRPLYAFLRRSVGPSADADDLFQEIFLRVIRAAPRWKREAKFTTWMYTIARNALIDRARRRKTRPPPASLSAVNDDGTTPLDQLSDVRPLADSELVEAESARAIETLVEGLPSEQRETFLLKREGLTFDAIAEIAGVSRNTAKSRLRYALEKLRVGLRERGLLCPPTEHEVRR